MKTFGEYLIEATSPVRVSTLMADIEKALSKLEGREVRPVEVKSALLPIGKKYQVEFGVKRASDLEVGDTSIFAYYDDVADKDNARFVGKKEPVIELLIVFSKHEKLIPYTKETLKDLARGIAETLSHELIHMSQARERNWKQISTKQKYVRNVKLKDAGAYLANDDEIEAHAWNIAGSLLDYFNGSKDKALKFLNRPKAGVIPEVHFDMYLNVFGLGHAVMKRLYKKIITYIDIRLTGN